MALEKKVTCPWCGKESTPRLSKEKSDYGDMIVRKCGLCEKILASYLDEEKTVLEKVRTFQN